MTKIAQESARMRASRQNGHQKRDNGMMSNRILLCDILFTTFHKAFVKNCHQNIARTLVHGFEPYKIPVFSKFFLYLLF